MSTVKSMKSYLNKVGGDHVLTLEEFTTLLTQIKAMLNSHSLLAPTSNDVDIFIPLHFAIHRSLTIVSEVSCDESSVYFYL